MLTLLDRYVGRSMILSFLLVFGVFAALFFFVSLVEALGDYGKGSFGLRALAVYVVLSQPRKLYEIFPVTMLIGTLLGLSTLAINAELTAMRAAGVSKSRILVSTIKTGVLLVVFAVLAGEYVVPDAETRAQIGRSEAMEMSFKQGNTGLWLRDGASFVNVGEVLPDLSLLRVYIYDIAPDYTLREHLYAARAVYADHQWRLQDVRASRIEKDQRSVQTEKEPTSDWNAGFTPAVIAVFTIRPEALSITQLYAYIQHLRSNSQDVGRYVLAFWQKCFMPLAAGVMILLAAPFVFRPVRSGGLAQRAFVGVLLGLVFVVVNRSLGYLGLIYGVPPLAAAAAPIILFFGVALFLMRRLA